VSKLDASLEVSDIKLNFCSMSKQQRRLAAIMFTDIVGYSSMMQKNETLAAQLRARHREVFDRLHKKYGGEILQYFGDGTLSIFPSTVDAVECAVELQRELKESPQVPIRVGIHTGDITFSEEEAIGDGVNIAARIQSISVPGGVFISGKAYDDIKNHPELRTRAIGQFPLKNIHQKVDLYAVTNYGLTVPDYEWEQPEPMKLAAPSSKKVKGRKKKWVAALLAFFFGVFGLHRFYLEQRNLGILYLSMFFLGAFILQGAGQLVAIPAILGFVDFLIFLTMSRNNFDEKYNKEVLHQTQHRENVARAKANDPKNLLNKQYKKYLAEAKEAYNDFEYDLSIKALLKAIEIKYDDPETHFFLAQCYSVTEKTERALHHLDIAVAFGLKDTQRIKTDGDLAYLRVQPEYEAFEQNGFQLPKELPSPQKEPTEPDESVPADLLDQLARLKKERDAGLLTEEEYVHREQQLKSKGAADDL
jgi:class 3 adenylate cyclase